MLEPMTAMGVVVPEGKREMGVVGGGDGAGGGQDLACDDEIGRRYLRCMWSRRMSTGVRRLGLVSSLWEL